MDSEEIVHFKVCDYLKTFYPDVIFLTDASGIALHPYVAKKFAKLKSSRGMPDLIILFPNKKYYGLLIELKKANQNIFTTKGKLKTDHLNEQANVLKRLHYLGYYACVCIGYKSAIKTINQYMTDSL